MTAFLAWWRYTDCAREVGYDKGYGVDNSFVYNCRVVAIVMYIQIIGNTYKYYKDNPCGAFWVLLLYCMPLLSIGNHK